jgi:hypothetical protein
MSILIRLPCSQDKKPYIDVDEYQNTKAEGVYALGDVCGPVELTPTAIAAGRRLSDRLFGNLPESKADYDFVPTVCNIRPDSNHHYSSKNLAALHKSILLCFGESCFFFSFRGMFISLIFL